MVLKSLLKIAVCLIALGGSVLGLVRPELATYALPVAAVAFGLAWTWF